MKKRLLSILAGVSVFCITYTGAVFENNDVPINEMQVGCGTVNIVSQKPISAAENMKKFWKCAKETGEVLTDVDDTILYNNSQSTDESKVRIVSVEPISSEQIQENINNCTGDVLTDPVAREDEIPVWTFDLKTDVYEKPFHFERYVYTNRLFTTPHGMINVVISGDNALSSSLDTGYTIERYKEGDSKPISSLFLKYGQEYHLEYAVPSPSEKYYFKLSKTSSGSYVNGTIWVG